MHIKQDIVYKQFFKVLQLVIHVGGLKKTILSDSQNVSNSPFNYWICTQSSWVIIHVNVDFCLFLLLKTSVLQF
jgi:hypothetical protein